MKTKLERAETPITLTLTMSEREAKVLRTICYHIAGDPRGPRGTMSAIAEVLGKNGIEPYTAVRPGHIILPDTWATIEAE